MARLEISHYELVQGVPDLGLGGGLTRRRVLRRTWAYGSPRELEVRRTKLETEGGPEVFVWTAPGQQKGIHIRPSDFRSAASVERLQVDVIQDLGGSTRTTHLKERDGWTDEALRTLFHALRDPLQRDALQIQDPTAAFPRLLDLKRGRLQPPRAYYGDVDVTEDFISR